MQHPDDHLDEGTIHAWLDGALSGDEARAVEAHVAGCARCAEAVAGARGLIAAASGILAKLDAVPSGVVPRPAAAAPPRAAESGAPVVPIDGLRRERRRRAPWWSSTSLRVAAALLVVASGTFVVAREQRARPGDADSMIGFSVNRASERTAPASAAAEVAAPGPPPAPPSPAPALSPAARARPEMAAPREAEEAPPSRIARKAPAIPRADVAPMTAPTPAPSAEQSLVLRAPAASSAPVAPGRSGVVGAVGGGAGAAGGAAADSSAVVRQSLAARDARLQRRAANVADAAGAAAPSAKASAAAPAALPFPGPARCYELDAASWVPAEPAVTTPWRLVLEPAPLPPPHVVSSGAAAPAVRALGPAGSPLGTGYWLPLDRDSVRVEWIEGTTHVVLRARLSGDSLRGQATTLSDGLGRPVQRAALSARRVTCPAP